MATFHGYAATAAKAPLTRYDFDPGPLADDEVEIAVAYCGVCHSDLSMLDNDWGMSTYPLVPGHEVAGTVAAVGSRVTSRQVGERVGLGWTAGSCRYCKQCQSGDGNLCATSTGTIVGRPGGFADRVRCKAEWAVPIPSGIDLKVAGPLFCGGATVFNPLVQFDVPPTARAGVVGVGGLGHMALRFLNKWGCDVTAFTSSAGKEAELRAMGAHHVVSSTDSAALKKIAGTIDFLLVTVNVALDWASYLEVLAPKGRLHVVGAVLEPIPVGAFALIMGQKSISGSPVGSPSTIATLLDFCARHSIAPQVEVFPMSKVNDALAHVRANKARYRVVLQNDLGS